MEPVPRVRVPGTRAAPLRRSRRARRAASAYTFSASSGHSTAASAARSVSTSSRSWNDRPPTSRCGTLRASSASTYGRVMSVRDLREAAEEDADVPRLDGHQPRTRPSRRSVTVQPLSRTQPVHPRADGIGKRRLDRAHRDVPHPVWIGNGEDDDGSAGRARLQARRLQAPGLARLRSQQPERGLSPGSLRALDARRAQPQLLPVRCERARSRPAATRRRAASRVRTRR